MRRWGKTINRNQPQGQIAVFLVFLIVLVFILITITTNVSKVSSMKTAVSNVADSTALYYASQVGSWAWVMWYRLLVEMNQLDRMNQQDPANSGNYKYDFCYMNWSVFGTFMALIFMIIITILSWGTTSPFLAKTIGAFGALLTLSYQATVVLMCVGFGLELAGDIALEGRQLGQYSRAINKLPPEGRIAEDTAHYAFEKLVDDPKKLLDTHDLNGNGRTDDYIYRFNLLNSIRVNKIVAPDDLILGLADRIGSFCLTADTFRQYCGGDQQFPELGYDQSVADKWITRLKASGYPLLPDNNRCYYQGGELTKLMADFRAEWLKCEGGTGQKPFMNITNVDLRNLTAAANFVIEPLPEYKEEFPYYFPFWSGNVSEPSNPNRNPDNIDNPEPPPGAPTNTWGPDPLDEFACKDLGGKGNDPARTTSIDEVDQVTLQLEKYRSWARGSFGYRYEVPADPETMPLEEYLEFLYGIGRRLAPLTWPDRIYGISSQSSDQDIQRTFTGWYRQLYDVDNEGGEQAKMTWYTQIQYFLNKTGSYANNSCGWFREFRKILEDKQFINLEESDVVGLYAGLDTVNPPPGVTSHCGGKRKELKDKMDRVCTKLTALITAYNALPRCQRAQWDISTFPSGFCTSGSVDISPSLSVSACSNCFQVGCSPITVNTSCIATLIQQITGVRTTIKAARDTLQAEWTKCDGCCDSEQTICRKKCLDEYNLRIAWCDSNTCAPCSGPPPTCNCNSSCPPCVPRPFPLPPDCTAQNECWSDYYDCMRPCWDYWQCLSDCAWCKQQCWNVREMCYGNCTTIHNTCSQNCSNNFKIPKECRDQELAKLDVIMYYAQKLQTLANALSFVETLIQRVETAQRQINAFYDGATPLLAYVDANKALLADRTTYLRSGGYVVNQDGAEMTSIKDGLDTVFTYKWPTAVGNTPIMHKVSIRLGPCKLATGRPKRCRWVFGRGGELIDHTSVSNGGDAPDLVVTIRREDQSSNLVLRIFEWLFQTNVVSARAKAAYSPRAEDSRKPIKLIEASTPNPP
jgi:hypothetical protein